MVNLIRQVTILYEAMVNQIGPSAIDVSDPGLIPLRIEGRALATGRRGGER